VSAYLTIAETARALNVSTRTVRREIADRCCRAAGTSGQLHVCAFGSGSCPVGGRLAEREEAGMTEWADAVIEALTSEDEIGHGEAVKDGPDGYVRLGVCAYCDGEWPCRTQRGIDRLLAAVASLNRRKPG
jgi:hypothetical protein